jgi:predicted MPP superfamily phosphohydrolase
VSPVVVWSLLAAAVAAVATIGLWAVLVAPYRLARTDFEVAVAGLPPAFDGYRVAVLSDLHLRPGQSLRYLRRAVTLSNEAAPDLVALLGDYGISFKHQRPISRILYERALPAARSVLAGLEARDGVVAVLGNHDYYADAALVREWLASLDARVLVNARAIVERDGARLVVAGLDDVTEGAPEPRAGCAAGERPHLVLSHNPDGVRVLSPDLGEPLVLSGHTHGGQIVLPLYGAPLTMSRVCGRTTASGWVPNPWFPLYVARGVGVQIPIRFGAPPELLVVRLRRADDEDRGRRQHPV